MRKTPHERFWPKVNVPTYGTDACWEWNAAKSSDGYGMFWLSGRFIPAHRFLVHIPSDKFACHHCDNPSCVRPSHIFAGTALDNTRDCISKGRLRPENGLAAAIKVRRSLTDDQVREIRRLAKPAANDGARRRLARQFGVGPHVICWVVNRQKYRHVE